MCFWAAAVAHTELRLGGYAMRVFSSCTHTYTRTHIGTLKYLEYAAECIHILTLHVCICVRYGCGGINIVMIFASSSSPRASSLTYMIFYGGGWVYGLLFQHTHNYYDDMKLSS